MLRLNVYGNLLHVCIISAVCNQEFFFHYYLQLHYIAFKQYELNFVTFKCLLQNLDFPLKLQELHGLQTSSHQFLYVLF